MQRTGLWWLVVQLAAIAAGIAAGMWISRRSRPERPGPRDAGNLGNCPALDVRYFLPNRAERLGARMGDRMTESFEPYRPESSYELDYDEEPEPGRGGRILWGRVAILGLALLLAFLFGRATGGGEAGVPQARFDSVSDERDELEVQVQDLEAQLEAAQQATPAPSAAPTDDPADDGTATDPEGETEGGETYVVKQGDTLATIAEQFYGNASLDDFLAEANGITDPEALAVGTELVIPPEPEE